MHVRTGAFVERDMYMWAERVDAEVEAEWALLEAPEHASYNQAAVFNIRVHFNSYLFRYSWQRRRHGERGVAFLFPGRRAALLRLFWGAKGQDEKDRHSEGEKKRASWHKKGMAPLSPVLTGHPVQKTGPGGPGATREGGVCVWARSSSFTWWLCPRQITSGAAVTVSLDQDKQPCFKISTCPLHRPFYLIHTQAHPHLVTH